MKWREVPLEEVVDEIVGGGTPSKAKKEYWNGDIPWCSVKDMKDSQYYLSKTQEMITEAGLKNSSAKLIKKGTVITATRMGLGRVFINRVDMSINQDLKALIPNEKIDRCFLMWALSFKKGEIIMQGRGATVTGITVPMLKKIRLPRPTLSIQEKMAEILNSHEFLIEKNQRQIELLEEVIQRIYKEWFVDFKFPGHSVAKFINGIPERWKKGQARDFFHITIGQTPPRVKREYFLENGKGVPWVSISDMGNTSVFLEKTKEALTEDAIKKCNVKVVPKGTIFLSFKLTIGRIGIATADMCSNEAIAHFHISEETLRVYAYCYLKNFEYDTLGNTSSISKAVNSKKIKAMPFVIPDEVILRNFSDILIPVFRKIRNLQKQIDLLTEARDRLLPKLMSGEIEV